MALQFPTRILVALDGSEASRHALTTACELGRATGSELHLVYVATTSPTVRGRPLTPAQREAAEQEGERVLEAGRRQTAELGVEAVQSHLRSGVSIDQSLQQAQEDLDAGLLVVGAHRSGKVAGKLITGGGGAGVVRRAAASILVVRPPAR